MKHFGARAGSVPGRASNLQGNLDEGPKKKDLADQFLDCGAEDVLRAVVDIKSHYDAQHGLNKNLPSLAEFSKCLFYYGNIVDVLVQQHTEYVSLVWGAMKFLFGVINPLQNR